jgi:RNA polymerase sigma-70 factor (ECF subfamily)
VEPNAELVQRAIDRDPAAVHQLVTALSPVVQGRIAKALMRRRGPHGQRRDVAQEVEDLTQEVFLALFDHGGRALRAWDPKRSPLGAFVALIADHQVFSIFRSGKRRPWTDDIDILHAPDTTIASTANDPEARVASKQALDSLLDRLRADLSVRGFELFTRLFVEEQSVETVSAELGMSADAIYAWRSRLAKVVKTLSAEPDAFEMSETAARMRTSPVEQSP